jgi:hypothetical protein
MGGGVMAMIHLVLKRPIYGALGVTGAIIVGFGGYPVIETVSESVRQVSGAIDRSLEDGTGFLAGKLEIADRRRLEFLKSGTPSEKATESYADTIGRRIGRPDTVSIPSETGLIGMPESSRNLAKELFPVGFE